MVRHEPISSDSENYSDFEVTSKRPTRTLRSRNTKSTKKSSRKAKKSRRQVSDDESSDISDFQDKESYFQPKNKKRRLKQPLSSKESDDSEDISEDSNTEEEEEERSVRQSSRSKVKVKPKKVQPKKKKKLKEKEKHVGRRKIKQIITENDLNKETKKAEIEEERRRKRLKEREGEKIVEIDLNDSIPLIDPIPITKKLVLQKEPFVEVHPEITVHLKPHQVEGIQFIWDNLVENTERAKAESGSGCILAHCMGLGKTLQTIASLHTIFHCKELSLKTVLIVAPLNTLLNWVDEFHKWCPDDQPIKVYNLTEFPTRRGRLNVLKEWRKRGGAMILGYDMFRLLATGVGVKYKPWRIAFEELLLDPGPDLVVCDEGHKLKNSDANISMVMNKIHTMRRLVLTGTPLQNNLIEYQCMVNFVKPNLLGSQKEFRNRFVNPILNGQHSDSTVFDVKLMKNRCHILHEMLQGFVQRKDYTALAEYLCDKKEYILKVRLSNEQIDLYRHFLNTRTNRGENPNAIERGRKDTGLFADYQNLLRIWTHPRILQLHTIREVKRASVKYVESSDEAISTDHEYIPEKPKGENGFAENSKITTTEKIIKNSATSLESSDEENRKKSSKRSQKKSQQIEMSSSDEEEDEEEDQSEAWEESTMSPQEEGEEEEESSDEEEGSSDEEEEMEIVKKAKPRKNRYRMRIKDTMEDDNSDERDEFTDEWFSTILPSDSPAFDRVEAGGKVAVLFEILRLAKENDDKVLVFSQSLLSLDLIEEMLQLSTIKAESNESANKKDHNFEKWYKNVDYYRMDGSSVGKTRQRCINDFNSEEDRRGRLFLISTKAGSLGVNLVAANRVVIFDASWNPSHDIQSIFRVYRFGQTKCCYIYRLVAQGTMEEKIYDRQVAKQSLAFRVVDEQQINRHFTANDLQELYHFTPSMIPEKNEAKDKHVLPEDDLLADILRSSYGRYISTYHKHDSLLDHQEAEELTEEERKAAWNEYENEKKGIVKQRAVFVPAPDNIHPLHSIQIRNNSSLMLPNPFGVGAVPIPPSMMPQLRISQEEKELTKYMTTSHFMDPLRDLPPEQQELAKKIFILMFQKKQKVLELQAKSNLYQPLDKNNTIASIKSMPIYKSLTDDALALVFFDLQMKQRQALNNIKKEIKPHEAELNWLQAKYRSLLNVNKDNILPNNNKDLPSTSNTAQEQPVILKQENDKTSKSDLAEASKFARSSFAGMMKVMPASTKEKITQKESSPKVQLKKLKPSKKNKEIVKIDSD